MSAGHGPGQEEGPGSFRPVDYLLTAVADLNDDELRVFRDWGVRVAKRFADDGWASASAVWDAVALVAAGEMSHRRISPVADDAVGSQAADVPGSLASAATLTSRMPEPPDEHFAIEMAKAGPPQSAVLPRKLPREKLSSRLRAGNHAERARRRLLWIGAGIAVGASLMLGAGMARMLGH